MQILYIFLAFKIQETTGIIPSVPDHNEDVDTEVSKLVSTPSDLTFLSTSMNDWFQKFKPNEASWVDFFVQVSVSAKTARF